MRKLMTVLATALLQLCVGQSSAQEKGGFIEYAKIQRAGGVVTCVANDPRPLLQVLDAVTEEYGWSIDYEDPPYQSRRELADVTDAKWRSANPMAPAAMQIRGGAFRTTYPESAATATSDTDKAVVIKKVVADYNGSGNPGQFTVRKRGDGRLEIVGISVKDDAGAQLATTPILDTPITLQAGTMNAADAVVAIVTALDAKLDSKSDIKVGIGILPTNLMMQTQVKVSGGEMSARDALHLVLSQAKGKLFWRLLYDAGLRSYYLSVLITKRVQYDTFGNRRLELIR
jgi:hypothetical protein